MKLPRLDSFERHDDALPTRTPTLRRRALVVAVSGIFAASFAVFSTVASGDPPASDVGIKTLSARPNLVSGGDVLVQITLKHENRNHPVSITLNGHDVSGAFHPGDVPNTLIGLVTGLNLGKNTLGVQGNGSSGLKDASLEITNYSIKGPIISGPQIHPFICQTQDFTLPDGTKLGLPTDFDCSAPTKVQHVYRSTNGGALKPMPSTGSLPPDVAMTTTTTGATVPFVVRVETGTLNRGIYQNAVLHDPTHDPAPSPTTPPIGWNRRLIAEHGTGCAGGWYIQGAAEGINILSGAGLNPVTPDNIDRLGEGYAIFTNTLNHPTNSCNATVAGETTMMGKEHFIETFGVPFYTVSVGASGGSYSSLQVADAFPGLFDGILIGATFPDALSISMAGLDSKLLSKYYLTNNAAAFTEGQIVSVSGHKNARAWYDLAAQSGRTDPVPNRADPLPASPFLGPYRSAVWNAAVPTALRYDPSTNPTAARPTVFDVARNIYGVDASGFALRPFDNVGVQYGVLELKAGTITKVQFLDLNELVGGYDRDGNYVSSRASGDVGAIMRVYQSGLQLGGGGGLASIPVFDTAIIYDEDQIYHYQWFHFAARERMLQANGDTSNHVMWRGGAPITETSPALGGTTPGGLALSRAMATGSWAVFIKWMEAYKADTSSAPQRDKVIRDKPAEAVDGCFTKSLTPLFIAEPQTLNKAPNSQCNALWPSWTAPRIEAGGPLAANNMKCQLKPIDLNDYQVNFTSAELTRLHNIFPNGVCDWSKPGVNQTGVVTWASFGPSPDNLVFDITK